MSYNVCETISSFKSTQTMIDHTSLKNIVWLVTEKAFLLFSTLISTSLIARYLGPNQYGNYVYVSSIILIFQSVAMLGADAIVVRDLSIRKYETKDFLKTIFIIRLSGASSNLNLIYTFNGAWLLLFLVSINWFLFCLVLLKNEHPEVSKNILRSKLMCFHLGST